MLKEFAKILNKGARTCPHLSRQSLKNVRSHLIVRNSLEDHRRIFKASGLHLLLHLTVQCSTGAETQLLTAVTAHLPAEGT